MESRLFTLLPSIVSTKPFYIRQGTKPSPFRYRTPQSETKNRTISYNRVLGHEKSMFKLQELRGYIQNTISKQKIDWKHQIQRKRQQQQAELELKKKWVLQQRLRHKNIMKQMRQYLQAIKKYYWTRSPCPCGCSDQFQHIKKQPKVSKIEKQPLKFRLNNIPLTSFNGLQKKQINSTLSQTKLKSTNISIASKIIPQVLKSTVTNYFSLLTNFEKNVKHHLNNTSDVSNVLQNLMLSQNKSTHDLNEKQSKNIHNILKVLSLTKNHWQKVFRSVLSLKRFEDRLIKIARESDYEIQYNETEKSRKYLLDDMYNQLLKNSQYFKHIQKQVDNMSEEQFISSLRSPQQKNIQAQNRENQSNILEQQSNNFKSSIKTKNKQILENKRYTQQENKTQCVGQKAQIHTYVQEEILEFMKNQNLIQFRKKANDKRTLLQTFGIIHLVKRGGTSNNSQQVTPDSSFYNQTPRGKQNSKRVSGISSIFQSRNSSIRHESIRNQGIRLNNLNKKTPMNINTNKTKQKSKKKKKGLKLEMQIPNISEIIIQQLQQIPDIPDQIVVVQSHSKSQSKFRQSNFLNGLTQKIALVPKQSSLKEYTKQNIYQDDRQNMFNKVKSIRLRKRLQNVRQIPIQRYSYSKIQNHQNRGVLKTRLFQLFKLDYYNFHKQAQQFLQSQDKMDQNLEFINELKQKIYQGCSFDWIQNLDFNIQTKEVDMMDLIYNEKIKRPVKARPSVQTHDQYIQFNKVKTLTFYERQCQQKRLKSFNNEIVFTTHRYQKGQIFNTLQQYI